MAASLLFRTKKPHCCRNGALLSLVIVILLASQARPLSLVGYRPKGTFTVSSDGLFQVSASDKTRLQLYIVNSTDLDSISPLNSTSTVSADDSRNHTNSTESPLYNLVVKFTTSDSNCDRSESLYGSGSVSDVNQNGNTFHVEYLIEFPLVDSNTKLYFCLAENDQPIYTHQGNDDSVKLEVTTDLLPLAVQIIFVIVLMILSGMFSGLNLGLMALDPTTLKIIEKSGTKRQKRYAKIIHRVRRRGNYLLCTLLLGNVLVNSTFTILLDGLIGNGIYAVIGSTMAIVIFGEIVPQAICSRYGLFIGANTIWLTYLFMLLTLPLSLPISLILDVILGKEIGAVYNRDQLLELLHVTQKETDIADYEMGIISGALQLKNKTVSDVMTKLEHVYCIDIKASLDFNTMKDIYDSGFSRIPIYEGNRSNIIGVLYLRDLTFIDPDDCTPVRQVKDYYQREPEFVYDDTALEDMLKDFSEGKHHIAIVRSVVYHDDKDPEYETKGIVTLEDIIEEILGREIVDEYDQIEDNVTRKPRERKQYDISEAMYTTPIINLTAPQLLAVKQFLASAVPPFQPKHITKVILEQLLQQDILFQITQEDTKKNNFCLYKLGVPANYFVLLLEGCLEVHIGQDGMMFEARGFHHFGSNILLDVCSGAMKYDADPYIPDFTVKANTDCLLMLITRRRYMAAYRASQFQLQQAMSNGDDITKKEVEVFQKEWKEAESSDLASTSSVTSGLDTITRLLQTKPFQTNRFISSPSMRSGMLQASPLGKLSNASTPQRFYPSSRWTSPSGISGQLSSLGGNQSNENQQQSLAITLEEEEEEETEEEEVITEREKLLKVAINDPSSGSSGSPKDALRTSPTHSETKL